MQVLTPPIRHAGLSESHSALKRGAINGLLVMVVVTAAMVPRVAQAILPPNPDQGLFVTIGEVLGRGGVVGRDTWDNKPPGAYYLYAAVLRFGPDYSQPCTIPLSQRFFPPNPHEVPCAQILLSAFDALYAVALSIVVGSIARRLFGRLAGAAAAVLCAIFGGMLQILNGGGSPDFFALLPSTLAYWAALRYAEDRRIGWLVLAGGFGASAILFKQTGAVLLAGIGGWLLVSVRARRQPLGALIAGAVVVLAIAALILGGVGGLADVIDQAVLFNFAYVGAPANVNNMFVQVVRQTGRVFFGSQSALWLAALGGLCALWPKRSDTRVALVIAWMAASVASLLLGGAHLLDYYYVGLIPAFSVAGSYGLIALWQAGHTAARLSLVAATATLVAYSSQYQVRLYGNAWYSRMGSTTHVAEEFVAGSLRGGDGSLFVWGNGAQVYALSGRPPATRFLHTLALSYDYAYHDRLERNRAEVMTRLTTTPPSIIAVDAPSLRRAGTLDFPELRTLIERDYQLMNNPSNPIYEGWELYRYQSASPRSAVRLLCHPPACPAPPQD